jgi:hypothetical protein
MLMMIERNDKRGSLRTSDKDCDCPVDVIGRSCEWLIKGEKRRDTKFNDTLGRYLPALR